MSGRGSLSLVLGLARSGHGGAGRASKQVRELFEVMHMSQMFGQMNSQMAGVMGQAAALRAGHLLAGIHRRQRQPAAD